MAAEEVTALYEVITVVRRSSGELIVYRCLRRLSDGFYFVQSADRIMPENALVQERAHAQQFWELLSEEAPEVRTEGFSDLQTAIAAFDREFQ